MSIKISLPESFDMKPKITVFGVGGAGGNAVNNMISSNLEGVEFWVANTDAQALEHSLTNNRIQLGTRATLGLGAGSHPEVGKQAAEESIDELYSLLENTNMVFITAGMGGGTGTGGAPVIAKAAKDKGILTVGVVTKPFHFEGARRMKVAELGLEELNRYVDTLIVIPNQNLFRIANENTTFADAFKMADDVLYSGVRGITDLITMPGLINLDFADIRTVISEMGKAMMGTGEDEGEDRAIKAAEKAISNPLLDNTSMKGARGVLINITGGSDMTLFQVDAAANRIREEVDPNANIIFGSAYNSELEGKIRVSVVATGIDARHNAGGLRAQISENEGVQSNLSTPASRLHDAFSNASIFDEHEYNPEIKDTKEDEDEEDDGQGFMPPKPMELNIDTNFGATSMEHQSGAQSQASNSIETQANAPFVSANNQNDLSNNQEQDNQNDSDADAKEVSNSNFKRKSKEDFFDIPAFIRKRMKF